MKVKKFLTEYWWTVLLLILIILCIADKIVGVKTDFSEEMVSSGAEGLIVDEIMVRNGSVYTEYGFTDYVELYNPTDSNIDLSGISLSDDPNKVRYSFSEGVYIRAGERVVFPLNSDTVLFGLSEGEIFCIFEPDGTLYFSCVIPKISKNSVLQRTDEGNYLVSVEATPGYPGTDQGRADYLISIKEDVGVHINEVSSENLTLFDGSDWVELVNEGDKELFLDGFGLSDSLDDLFKVRLENTVVKPGEYIVLSLGDSFGLSAGETVYLSSAEGIILDSVDILEALPNQSQGRDALLFQFSPAYPNSFEGENEFLSDSGQSLIISEVMSRNNSYLRGPYGETHDYIEFTNISDQPIDLSRYSVCKSLSDDPQPLGEGILQPGEAVVCHAENGGYNFLKGYTKVNFGISSEGDTVILLEDGIPVDVLNIPELGTNVAYGRGSDKRTGILISPSPGKLNGEIVK